MSTARSSDGVSSPEGVSGPEGVFIDPDMPAAWTRMAEIARAAGTDDGRTDLSPAEMRARVEAERAWWNADRPELAEIVETTMPGPNGPVPVRLLYPNTLDPVPAIVYLHGGGWVVGSLETHGRAMHYLALQSGACVVGVDYSLAPEAKFPSAIEEIVAVTRHCHAAAEQYRICPARMAIAGDSAGGNLAIAAALRLRETQPDLLKALGLIYPVTGTDFETESYRTLGEFGLNRAGMEAYFEMYLRGPEDYRDPLAVPMLADLAGLPPSYVYAAGLDVLRDDSVGLDRRLREAGVPGHLEIFEGVPHAFLSLTRTVPAAHKLIRACARDLGESLQGVLP